MTDDIREAVGRALDSGADDATLSALVVAPVALVVSVIVLAVRRLADIWTVAIDRLLRR